MENVTMSKEAFEKARGRGVGFERIRRITGYLVGTLDRFNSGKKAEEHDRVKHTVSSTVSEVKTEKELVEVA